MQELLVKRAKPEDKDFLKEFVQTQMFASYSEDHLLSPWRCWWVAVIDLLQIEFVVCSI